MKTLFTLLPLLCLAACTVTKRHFAPGYQVEWKKSHAKTEHEPDQLNISDAKQEHSIVSDEKKELPGMIILPDSVTVNEALSKENLEISIKDQTIVSETQVEESNISIQSEPVSNDEEPIEEPKRRVEPFTWPALGGLLLGLLLVLISFLATSPELILSIAMFIGIGVIVCSIISVAHIRKNPERYKGKGLSWTLFGLSTVGIGAVLFVIVYSILLLAGKVDFL